MKLLNNLFVVVRVRHFVFMSIINAFFLVWTIGQIHAAIAVLDLERIKPEVTTLSNGSKTVRFVSMQHIAKPEFYQAVKAIVAASKVEGFVLFYEFIDFYTLDDIGQRKVRKAVGLLPMPDVYEKIFNAASDDYYLAQRNAMFLGLENKLDFNIDMAAEDFLNAIEHRYGRITLSQSDLSTPITEMAPKPLVLPWLQELILKRRNEILVRAVTKSDHKKIVVLYGAAHLDGFFANLSHLEPGWKKFQD